MDESSGNAEFIPRNDTRHPARPDEVLPETLQLVPLDSRPYFPVLIQPIVVDKEPWHEGLKVVAESAHKLVGLSFLTHPVEGNASPDDMAEVGCVARIHRIQQTGDKLQFIAQGLRRFRIVDWVRRTPPYVVRVEYPEEHASAEESQVRAYAMSLINGIKELMSLNPLYNEELKEYLSHFSSNEPSPLADFAAAITSADPVELQDILETFDLFDRMQKSLLLLTKELELSRIQASIAEQTQEQLSDQQREFFLRQQLKVIQKELGISKDDRESDADTFADRLEGRIVPDHVQARVDEEL